MPTAFAITLRVGQAIADVADLLDELAEADGRPEIARLARAARQGIEERETIDDRALMAAMVEEVRATMRHRPGVSRRKAAAWALIARDDYRKMDADAFDRALDRLIHFLRKADGKVVSERGSHFSFERPSPSTQAEGDRDGAGEAAAGRGTCPPGRRRRPGLGS